MTKIKPNAPLRVESGKLDEHLEEFLEEPMFSVECKEMAYKTNPEVWVSYSGKPKKYKQDIDAKRTMSLLQAKDKTERIKDEDNKTMVDTSYKRG